MFELKEDLVFSDGEPLTAEDVKFTYMLLSILPIPDVMGLLHRI